MGEELRLHLLDNSLLRLTRSTGEQEPLMHQSPDMGLQDLGEAELEM